MTWDICPLPWKQELRIVLTELNKWQKNLSSSPACILNLFLSFTRSSQPLCLSSSHHIHLQLHSVCFSLFSSSWLAFFNFILMFRLMTGADSALFRSLQSDQGLYYKFWDGSMNLTWQMLLLYLMLCSKILKTVNLYTHQNFLSAQLNNRCLMSELITDEQWPVSVYWPNAALNCLPCLVVLTEVSCR